jgi:hypothetical protein
VGLAEGEGLLEGGSQAPGVDGLHGLRERDVWEILPFAGAWLPTLLWSAAIERGDESLTLAASWRFAARICRRRTKARTTSTLISTALGEFKTDAAMTAPCSVSTEHPYLEQTFAGALR